ncbi:TPA: hypothetical protein ACGOVM_001477 [Streptococcus suis]
MKKRIVVVSKMVLALTVFGIAATLSPDSAMNSVLAEETINAQGDEQNLEQLKNQVLEKLHALAGGTGADQVFFERVSLTKEGQIQAYADVDTVIQNIQRESFRMDLIEEIRAQANRLYKENGLHREDSFVALYSHQRPESNLPSAIRYGFEEVKLTFSDIYSYQIEYLLNQYIKDENELVRNKQFILQHLQNYIPKIKDVLEVQGEYNRVLRLFNAQDEGERKTEFEAFADEMVRDISTSLQQIIWTDKETILTDIKKLETRILGTQLDRSELEKAKQELEVLSQQYTAKIQALPHIDSTADWNYLTVSQSDLENAKTVEEINTIINQSQLNWQFFYKKLQEISQSLVQVNQLEKSLGGEGTTQFRIPSRFVEPIQVLPTSPEAPTAVSESDPFIATKETIRKRNLGITSQILDVYYSATEEEFLKNQVVLDHTLQLEERSIQIEKELVEAYNVRIDKINTLSTDVRRETWLKFIYPKDFYLIEVLHLPGNNWTSLDEIEKHKQTVLSWMTEFDASLSTESSIPEEKPNPDTNLPSESNRPSSESEVATTPTPLPSSKEKDTLTPSKTIEMNKNQAQNPPTQVGNDKNVKESLKTYSSNGTVSAIASTKVTTPTSRGVRSTQKGRVASKVLPKTGEVSKNLKTIGFLTITLALLFVAYIRKQRNTV